MSRTAVASSPSTTVTATAAANTSASSRRGEPPEEPAMRDASALNSPARPQPSPITSRPASSASVGPTARLVGRFARVDPAGDE